MDGRWFRLGDHGRYPDNKFSVGIMRSDFVFVSLLLLALGCSPDPHETARKHVNEQIEKIKLGSADDLFDTPPDLFEPAAKNPSFLRNLKDVTLSGSYERYSNISLGDFEHLDRVCLCNTKETLSYLKALPPDVTVLVLDLTDLTYLPGMTQNLNNKQFMESWLQELTRFESLERIFICPWDSRLNPIAAKLLPQIKSLRQFEPEWATEEDVAKLQEALPNCHVKLITKH